MDFTLGPRGSNVSFQRARPIHKEHQAINWMAHVGFHERISNSVRCFS
jgi:hypothetical protein